MEMQRDSSHVLHQLGLQANLDACQGFGNWAVLLGSLGLLLESFLVNAGDLGLRPQIDLTNDVPLPGLVKVHAPFSVDSLWRVASRQKPTRETWKSSPREMRPTTPRGSCRDLAPYVCGKRNHLQRRHFLASFCLCRRGRHPPRLLLKCVSSSPSAPLLDSLSLSVGGGGHVRHDHPAAHQPKRISPLVTPTL